MLKNRVDEDLLSHYVLQLMTDYLLIEHVAENNN